MGRLLLSVQILLPNRIAVQSARLTEFFQLLRLGLCGNWLVLDNRLCHELLFFRFQIGQLYSRFDGYLFSSNSC